MDSEYGRGQSNYTICNSYRTIRRKLIADYPKDHPLTLRPNPLSTS